jgi:hypothetical protein
MSAAILDAVDRGNVGIVQGSQYLSFAREPGNSVGIVREGFGQHLDCHLAIESGAGGTIHRAHAALVELAGDAVMPDG